MFLTARIKLTEFAQAVAPVSDLFCPSSKVPFLTALKNSSLA
jgi:hypothetical protein